MKPYGRYKSQTQLRQPGKDSQNEKKRTEAPIESLVPAPAVLELSSH